MHLFMDLSLIHICIAESVKKGPLAAYPVTGIKAVLYDGSYHPVDSSEMAFKVATQQDVYKRQC